MKKEKQWLHFFQMWQYGNSSDINLLFRVGLDPYRLFRAHCGRLLGDKTVMRYVILKGSCKV